MKFAELGQYLDRMEGTREPRNRLVKLLSELYSKARSPDEIEPLTYLIQGRLAPFFEPIEIGMGEKLVMAGVAEASGRDHTEVSSLYDTLGDLGVVAANVSRKPSGRAPSITDVHAQLLKISASAGAGSVERKRTTFAALLKALDAASAKHLVRVALGRLRLPALATQLCSRRSLLPRRATAQRVPCWRRPTTAPRTSASSRGLSGPAARKTWRP